MPYLIRIALAASAIFVCTGASAFQLDGKLPIYPNGRDISDMPASAIAMGVPLVLETADSIPAVDRWYKSNAPNTCARSAQSGGVKYQCPGGSIMIYAKDGTQIAFVPAFPHF
jgi:hypothetical protein